MNDSLSVSTDVAVVGDAGSLWVTERLSGLMTANDVPPRRQAGLLCELCGLSPSQARRKLHGAAWSFSEVLAVVRHFGASLDELFALAAPLDDEAPGLATEVHWVTQQDASFLIGVWSVPCRVHIGARVVGRPGERELLTAAGEGGWFVGSEQQLAGRELKPPYFMARQVLLLPVEGQATIRVAILDDDPATAESLADWFNASGYAASAFTSADALLASAVDGYAAFIVDFMLGGGDSAPATIRRLRELLPTAPIVLLSGKLRSGQASEADLIALLRTLNVSFFEKPVRPSVLAASIENELDRIANAGGER